MFETLYGSVEAAISQAVGIVWGIPVVWFCILAGFFYTIRMVFIQFRCFPHALALISGKYDNPNETGQITHFQALSAALSGTIGLGNIAGVAIAIAMGGPGAVLWMWLIGIMGMATKYIECALGTIYREKKPDGQVRGGPMYYISKGLGQKWQFLAVFYSVCCAFAAYGAGNMFQSNQAATALLTYYDIPMLVSGLVLAGFVATVIIGGIKRIGQVASKIVPLMCGVYLLGALLICLINIDKLPLVLWTIVHDAFTGSAAAGGALGVVIKAGVRRAVFSNEAGLGSASIAHAAVKTDYPIREGIVASLGPLIDTIIVCTATAMVIIMSGHYGTEMPAQVGKAKISFEQVQTLPDGGGWQIVDQTPEESEVFRTYQDGKVALAYLGGAASETAVMSPRFNVSHMVNENRVNGFSPHFDALRFSVFRGGGEYGVQLLSATGDLVGSVPISKDGGTYYDSDGRMILTITPSYYPDQWHSVLVEFGSDLKSKILESSGSGYQMVFMAKGEDPLYVDRVQFVKRQAGIGLTTASFDKFFEGFGSVFITIAVFFFAFSTMITWSYYGETAAEYVWGQKIILPFKWLFVVLIFVGSIIKLDVILNFSDLMLGLMVLPNAVALIGLSGVVVRETKSYFEQLKAGKFRVYK